MAEPRTAPAASAQRSQRSPRRPAEATERFRARALATTASLALASLLGSSSAARAERAPLPQVLLEEITPAAFPMYVWNAGDERLFILERRGRIRIWTKKDGLLPEPFLDIDPLVGQDSERGLYTIAFHPDFKNNGYFFISYYESIAERVGVFRYRVSADDPNKADPTSALRVLEVPQPEHIHNGGQLMFGPDGYLWLGFGDGNAGDGGCRVQSGGYFLGKILRIDVDALIDGVPFSYAIPPDNPFVGAKDPTDRWPDEMFAGGFRHPWRFSIDFPTRDVWIGDVGGSRWEEIDRIPGGSPGGENFGWKIMEGPDCHSNPVPSNCPADTQPCFSPVYKPPLYTYSHSTVVGGTDFNGCAVIGGFVYRGSAIPELQGKYVFTDFCAQSVRVLDAVGPDVWESRELVPGVRVPNSMGMDADGELYIANLSKVFKIVPAVGRNEQTTVQQTCINAINRSASEIAKARIRANGDCVRFAARGQLGRLDGVPEDDVTVSACFASGLPRRIQRAFDGLVRTDARRCGIRHDSLPDFGYTSAATVETAGLRAAADLAASLWGDDPDTAIVRSASDPSGALCQKNVGAAVQRLYDGIWRRALDGKRRALRGRILSPARNATELGEKILGYVDGDTRSIPRLVSSLGREIGRSCDPSAIPALFPGACGPSGAAGFAACMRERARCHFCRQLEASDGLRLDCDAWDDGDANGSCPSRTDQLCSAPGTGVNRAALEVDCPRLQDYRLFVDPSDPRRDPAGGGVPYDLTTPLFSDYAQKYRFVFLPPGIRATYRPDDPFDFPVGTVIAKTFSFAHDLRDLSQGEEIVETRLLIHRPLGWVGLPYIWSSDRTEARLAPAGGARNVTWIHTDGSQRETTYAIPSVAQCGVCHSRPDVPGAAPIGPKARLLNRDYAYASGTENQLDHWTAAGLLAGAPPASAAPRLPVWDDPADGTLEQRARAYLETNCAHCHSPSGEAGFTGFWLVHDQPLDSSYGVCRLSDFDGGGPGLLYDLVPGDPDASIAILRMESIEEGVRMPELARSVVHEEGVALVRSWLRSLPAGCP